MENPAVFQPSVRLRALAARFVVLCLGNAGGHPTGLFLAHAAPFGCESIGLVEESGKPEKPIPGEGFLYVFII